jgi:hypothetical protein
MFPGFPFFSHNSSPAESSPPLRPSYEDKEKHETIINSGEPSHSLNFLLDWAHDSAVGRESRCCSARQRVEQRTRFPYTFPDSRAASSPFASTPRSHTVGASDPCPCRGRPRRVGSISSEPFEEQQSECEQRFNYQQHQWAEQLQRTDYGRRWLDRDIGRRIDLHVF